MRYLLDTNVFLFIVSEDFNSLSIKQREVIFSTESELNLSEASYYELAIKARMGKENFSHISTESIETDRKRLGIKLLKSKKEYYLNIVHVPKVLISANKLHADPFDLLIISQALIEKMPILSTDRYFPDYEGLEVIS